MDTPAFLPKADLNKLDMVFGVGAEKLLPPWDAIPAEFKAWNPNTKWQRFVSDWFYSGLKELKVTPRPGIDGDAALRHLRACIGSFEPKHEHKEAGCAYLASLWFEDVKYEKAKP